MESEGRRRAWARRARRGCARGPGRRGTRRRQQVSVPARGSGGAPSIAGSQSQPAAAARSRPEIQSRTVRPAWTLRGLEVRQRPMLTQGAEGAPGETDGPAMRWGSVAVFGAGRRRSLAGGCGRCGRWRRVHGAEVVITDERVETRRTR